MGVLIAIFGACSLYQWFNFYGIEGWSYRILESRGSRGFPSAVVSFYVYISIFCAGMGLVLVKPWARHYFFLVTWFYLLFLTVSFILIGFIWGLIWYLVFFVVLGFVMGLLCLKSIKKLFLYPGISKKVSLCFIGLFLISMSIWVVFAVKDNAEVIKADKEEDNIHSLVLRKLYKKDGGFRVVAPNTGLGITGHFDKRFNLREKIRQDIKLPEQRLSFLLDRLFEKNKNAVPLSIKSNPSTGYLIDFDGKFRKYFKANGGGWDRWYKENPKAHGLTTISRPVYDIRSGMVLIYIGTQQHWLHGAGYVVLYEYKNGELIKMAETMVWVS